MKKQPTLNQNKIQRMNWLVTIFHIELVCRHLVKKKKIPKRINKRNIKYIFIQHTIQFNFLWCRSYRKYLGNSSNNSETQRAIWRAITLKFLMRKLVLRDISLKKIIKIYKQTPCDGRNSQQLFWVETT